LPGISAAGRRINLGRTIFDSRVLGSSVPDCKLSPRTLEGQTAALRFLFVKTLGRSYLPDQIPFPKCHKRLPTVLSQEEVTKLIDSASSLMQRAMIMTLYATGVCRTELCRLKVSDIDSERMVLHVQQGKGGRDRDVPLSPKLLEILREYWRWMKPGTHLFQACRTTDAPMLRSRRRRLDCRSARRRSAPASSGMARPTHSGTASRPTCWKPAQIWERSSFCSDMPSSPIRRCTSISRDAICRRLPARWKPSLYRRQMWSSIPEGARSDEPAHPRGGRYHPRIRQQLLGTAGYASGLAASQGHGRYPPLPHCGPGRSSRSVSSLWTSGHLI
jgi:hypothetical protein